MVPHEQYIQDLHEIALYTIQRNLKPILDFHAPDFTTCWLWNGNMSKEGMQKYTQFSKTGRTTLIRENIPYPTLRLGVSKNILLHRFFYMIYRTPGLTVTKLVKARSCPNECCNPYHWEATIKDTQKSKSKPWPSYSSLHHTVHFTRGDMAQDEVSLQKRRADWLNIGIEYLKEKELTHAIITKEDYHMLKGEYISDATPNPDAAIRTNKMKEPHEFAKRYWMQDRFRPGEEETCFREQFKGHSSYLAMIEAIKPRGQTTIELDPAFIEKLNWYDCPLPPYKHEHFCDYWICRENAEDTLEYFYKMVVNKKMKTFGEILDSDKPTHLKLYIVASKKFRRIDIDGIDWSR